MSAAARLAEDVVLWQPFDGVSKWFFGGALLLTLLIALFVVTRFHIFR